MFVQRPDARLHSLSFGAGPRSLLALGGWLAGAEVWHEVFAQLPSWRCVGFDHRGSGASQWTGEITQQTMVDDLLAVADAQCLQCPLLAAESSGAAVALAAALQAPGRFAGLVLVGASWQRTPAGAADTFAAALRADTDAVLRRFARDCLPEPGSEDLQRWGFHMLRRGGTEGALALLKSREGVRVDERLEEIALPALVIHGTEDRIVPAAAAEELARRLPDAQLQLLPGLGHVPLLSAPARVAQLIEARFA